MLWGVPYALLLLAGVIPLILLLHSLKPKGLRVSSTTLFIWEKILRERPLTTRLGWLLRKNLLLILQVLAATLLITGLGDPQLRHFASRAGDAVVVIDMSASMKAKGDSGTRFDAARRQFFSAVDELAADQKMMVVGAAAQPRLMLPFTSDKSRLRELGRTLAATDAPGRVKEAILFAHGFLKRGTADHVIVISDGAFSGAQEYMRQAAHLRFIKIAGRNENIAIVGFEVRRRPDGFSPAEVMVHVRNFTAKAVRVPLTLTLAEKTIVRESIDIAPDGRRILIYPLSGPLTGTLIAALAVEDDFATDNRAYLALDEKTPVHVLYVGPGNPFLSSLLRFFPQVELTSLPRWQANGTGPQPDVIIFDRVPVPQLSHGNLILIDTLAPNASAGAQRSLKNPRIVSPLAKHPITKGLTLEDTRIEKSLNLAGMREGTVLARSRESPLLIAGESEKLRWLLIGFDLTASDLPLRVAFPILFHNTLEWFHPQRREFPAQSVSSGIPFELRLPTADNDVEVTAPSGRKERFAAVSSPLVYTDTNEAGLYSYKTPSRQGSFAVNLLSETESQINAPRTDEPSGKKIDSDNQLTTGFALWPTLLIAALLVLIVEASVAFRSRLPVPALVFRGIALASLLVALLDPKIFHATNALDVVLGVDLSRSVGQEGREKAQEILETAARTRSLDSRTGVLVFGGAPEWEFLPRENFSSRELTANLDREQTDIEAALHAALGQIGEGRQGKILLVSDGNENHGDTARALPLLRAQGVQVWTLPVSLSRGNNEIYLSELTLPRQVDSAQGFEITGTIESLRGAAARIKLLRDGMLLHDQDIRLKAGTNEVSFGDSLTQRGNHDYELLVESPEDTLAENNVLQGVVQVKGPPRVLLVSAQPDSQHFFSRMLKIQGYSVVESPPEKSAATLPELSSYDLLVLDNVPAFQLTQGKMENIEKYVRDLGGGLLVIGGPQSYGAGGYYRTPLENVLPVDMRPPARLDLPHVALLFVLDKSGSMGAGPEGSTKLDLAKAAAIAAADIMNPTDQVGILGFDAAWDWVLPFRPVGKGEWISEKLAGLQSDGGTDLFKAMVEAHRAIAGKQAAIKHVIVLSDGLTDKADFRTLVQRMAQDGITVSTVAVGNDADVQLMADIAKDGKGRGYVALDPQTIPQIFTTETLLISRDLLVEKSVAPTILAPSGPLKGIAQGKLPALRGYVLTYPKPRSETLMAVDKDPLLVTWRYGLGRVMAYTSDLSGRWGRDWLSWQAFPQWASQLARYTMRTIFETRMRADFHRDGEAVQVVADMISTEGKFLNHLNLNGNVVAPNKATQEQRFQQSAPGRYQSTFALSQRGVHLLTLYADSPGEAPLALATLPYIVPYPKEYRELKPNMALLSRLAESTGGEVIDAGRLEDGLKRLYTPKAGAARQGQETWWPLAMLGLFIFISDLVLRGWSRRGVDTPVA